MNTIRIAFIFFLSSITLSSFAQSPEDVDAYVEKYKRIAIEEQMNYGVPASITLAQGIHESACGMSELATQANNHFGIKCKNTWKGETFLHDDDAPKECFRKYPSAQHSFRDHSVFLKDNNRYHFLFDIEVTDYKAWASGLKRAGYATNPAYVSRLTNLIEKYNLQQYTYEALNKTFATPKEVVPVTDAKPSVETKPDPNILNPTKPETTAIKGGAAAQYYKGLQGFWAKKGEKLTQKALEINIRYPRLLLLNDLADAPLEHDQFIFTEKKRKVGTNEYHIVKEGEDMHYIAQVEAMMLEFLYQYNNMKAGQEPQLGERLNLQYRSMETPKLKSLEEVVKHVEETLKETPVPVAKKSEEIIPVTAVEEQKETVKTEIQTPPVEVEPAIVVTAEEQRPVVLQEEKELSKPAIVNNTYGSDKPIIDPEKARKIENLLATDNKKEVDSLAEIQKKEDEERMRKEKEMMERLQKNDEYARSVTARIDEDRRQVEARQDEEIKKRRALEDAEKKRIEEEQAERERLENLQAAAAIDTETAVKVEAEKNRLAQEEATKQAAAQEEATRLAQEKAERLQKDEEARKKRTYNEPGISDSVKNLKRTYDNIVYRSLPAPVSLKPSKSVKDSSNVKTEKASKSPSQPAKKDEPAKTNPGVKVTKTKTGIKREVNGKNTSKTNDKELGAQKGKSTKTKKEEVSKNDKNKKTETKQSSKNAKDKNNKGSKEDAKKKSAVDKKSDPKKKTKK